MAQVGVAVAVEVGERTIGAAAAGATAIYRHAGTAEALRDEKVVGQVNVAVIVRVGRQLAGGGLTGLRALRAHRAGFGSAPTIPTGSAGSGERGL